MKKKFNPSAIKALALDLDGTALLPDSSLGERTIRCLKRLIARGIQVIICTGRAVEASSCYYDAIGAEGPMVFFNGAVVADVPEAKVIASNLMGLDVVDYGIDLARDMGVHFQAFFPSLDKSWETLMVDRMTDEAKMYRTHTGIVPVVTDMKAAITGPGMKGCVKAMFITDPALHDPIREKMIGRFGDRVYIVRTYLSFLEIMNTGVSKGEGLRIAMGCRGLKPEEVIAFGDEENDLPMFSIAGYSAAPSGAKDNVREAADFVFGSNADEGIAVFLEELL